MTEKSKHIGDEHKHNVVVEKLSQGLEFVKDSLGLSKDKGSEHHQANPEEGHIMHGKGAHGQSQLNKAGEGELKEVERQGFFGIDNKDFIHHKEPASGLEDKKEQVHDQQEHELHHGDLHEDQYYVKL